jgi:class 3 adenylate cyclase
VGWVNDLAALGVDAGLSHSEQRRIRTINVVALIAFFLTALNMVVFLPARPRENISLLAYFFIAGTFLAGYALTLVLNRRGHHEGAAVLVLVTGLANLVAVSFTVGFESGPAVFLVTVAAGAVLVTSVKSRLTRWLFVVLAVVAYAVLVVVDPPAAPSIQGTGNEDLLVAASYAGMVGFVVAIVWYQRLLADRAEDALSEANERSERLLLNILPAEIAERLKTDEYPIADRKPDVTVLFADIVGSTAVAEQLTPTELVTTLDGLFSSFDDIADEHGLEKIKTVGDNYFAVAGLTANGKDHTSAAADAALSMRSQLTHHHFPNMGPVHMRFGMHTGPVIAGVIGKRKFSYDLWGDTVNTASRMESTSEQDMIQVSQQVYDRLNAQYDLETRGNIEVKGKGHLTTCQLIKKKPDPTEPRP